MSVEEKEAPVPDDSKTVAGLVSQIELGLKMSYASILKVKKEIAVPSSIMTAASMTTANKIARVQKKETAE